MRGGRWERWLWPAVMVLLLVWTVRMLLTEQSPAQLAEALRRADPRFLLGGFGLMLAYVGCEAVCTRLVLGTLGARAPLGRCLGYACIGFYFSTVTPSSTGGQPMQVYAMSRDGIPGAHGTLDMLLISMCYQVASALYAVAARVCFPGLAKELGRGWGLLLLLGLTITLALTAGMVLLLVRPGWCGWLADRGTALLGRLELSKDPAALRERLERPIAQYAEGGRVLWRRPSLVPRLLGLCLVQLCCLYLVPWTVYRAFGLSGHSVVEFVALQALLAVAVGFLPLPGAAGAAETAALRGYAAFFGGVAAPAVVLSRGISCYGMLAVTGVVALAIHLRRRRREAAAGPRA